MIEFLKHLFGFCGEPHASILMSAPIVMYILYNIKGWFK